MRRLIDADALSKLAHWKMLGHLPSLIGVPLSDCGTLSSVRLRALRALEKQDRLFSVRAAAQSALDVIDQMAGPIVPTGAGLTEFQNVPEIDAGEAVLLSMLRTDPDLKLLTGDKRCLRALAKLSTAKNYVGRIMILEQVLLTALEKNGLQWVRDRVCPHKHIDTAISASLGSNCDASEDSVREGLMSYTAEIQKLHTPPLLMGK